MSDQEFDPRFSDDVAAMPGGDQIHVCYACGTCTAGCPVTEVDPRFSPRRIIRQVLLGQRRAVLSNDLLWYCETCYACSSYCPQNVKFSDVMRALREMAVNAGYYPRSFAEGMRAVDALAHALRLDLVKAALGARDPARDEGLWAAIPPILERIKATKLDGGA